MICQPAKRLQLKSTLCFLSTAIRVWTLAETMRTTISCYRSLMCVVSCRTGRISGSWWRVYDWAYVTLRCLRWTSLKCHILIECYSLLYSYALKLFGLILKPLPVEPHYFLALFWIYHGMGFSNYSVHAGQERVVFFFAFKWVSTGPLCTLHVMVLTFVSQYVNLKQKLDYAWLVIAIMLSLYMILRGIIVTGPACRME